MNALDVGERLLLEALPEGYLSRFDKQLVQAIAESYRSVLTATSQLSPADPKGEEYPGPVVHAASNTLVEMLQYCMSSDFFPEGTFGKFDQFIMQCCNALLSQPLPGMTKQQHYYAHIHRICHDEKLFPSGPPSEFLDACEVLDQDLTPDQDPLVLIGYELIKNLLDSGQFTGTLDNMVCLVRDEQS